MDELKKQLYQMQELSYQLDYINGLVYILREALRLNEDVLNIHYTMASAYISNMVMDFEEDFDTLMENMFQSLRRLDHQSISKTDDTDK